jgi:hypothetical protein
MDSHIPQRGGHGLGRDEGRTVNGEFAVRDGVYQGKALAGVRTLIPAAGVLSSGRKSSVKNEHNQAGRRPLTKIQSSLLQKPTADRPVHPAVPLSVTFARAVIF